MRPGAEGSPPSPAPTGPRRQRLAIPALIVLVAALGTAHVLVSGLWLSRRLRTPAGVIPGKAGK